MAQLLESGHAKSFPEAYQKAIRFNDDVWAKEQQRQLTARRSTSNQAQIAKAKAIAVSPRSRTPGVASSSNHKDRRSAIEAAFEQFE
jgi:hypothetical protein